MMPFAHGTESSPLKKLPPAFHAGRQGFLLVCAVYLSLSTAQAQTITDIPQVIARLNSPRFFDRNTARQQISAWLGDTSLQPALKSSLQELLNTSTSFEARLAARQLMDATDSVAERNVPSLIAPTWLDWQQQLSLLSSDVFAQRQAAGESLSLWMKESPPATDYYARIKRQLHQEHLSLDTHRRLQPLLESTRSRWLLSERQDWPAPSVKAEQIPELIAALTQPSTSGPSTSQRRDVAQRELHDLLAYDEFVPTLREAFSKRLETDPLDENAQQRLQNLYDWSRPGLIAECWSVAPQSNGMNKRFQMVVQHLIVGVPQFAPQSQNPTHFGPVTAETAHCINGNTLSPGRDYPVGRAIPHPTRREYFFHLIYCPWPRQRMIYDCRLPNQAERLAEITRATGEYWLKEKRRLSWNEVPILEVFDPTELSRFASQYFMTVEDGPVEGNSAAESVHTEICRYLCKEGTLDLLPGLTQALRQNRIHSTPTNTTPFHVPWLAALLIASRNVTPETDTWLFDQIEITTPLTPAEFADPPPDVGAAAAYQLLTRHGQNPAQYGLEMLSPELRPEFHSYRFRSPANRAAVIKWWKNRPQSVSR